MSQKIRFQYDDMITVLSALAAAKQNAGKSADRVTSMMWQVTTCV